MSAGAAVPALRPLAAGATAPARASEGFFAFASTRLEGLPVTFWLLQAYFLLGMSAIDEEWPTIGALRPRLLLGVALLLHATFRLLSGESARGATAASPLAPATRPRGVPGLVPLVAFLAASLLSCAWAFVPSRAWTSMQESTVRIAAFFLLLAYLRTRREVLVTLLVFAVAHGFYLVRSVEEFLNGRFDFKMGVKRMLGAGTSFADPNSFAASVVLFLPWVAWLGIHTRSWLLRACCVLYGGVGAAAVVLARSRAGLVVLVLATLWTLASIPARRARFAIAAGLLLLGVGLATGMTDAAIERFAGIADTSTFSNDPSAHGRIEGYLMSWEMVKARPVLGVGPDNWGLYRARRLDGNGFDPHNLAGQLFATRGLVGGFAFLAFVAVSVAFAWRTYRGHRRDADPWRRAVAGMATATLMTYVLLLVSGLAAHNLDRPTWYWTPALLLAAVRARDATRGATSPTGLDPRRAPEPLPS